MAVRAPRSIAVTGIAPVTYAASAGGDSITNTSTKQLFLRVTNGSGAGINVTVDSPTACNQGGTHDLVVAVAAGVTKEIGPLPARRFGPAVAVTYSAAADVLIDPVLV